jgi:hypothetical protein
MPIDIHLVSAGEVFTAAIDTARDMSVRILKLADLSASPLLPGETPDNRRHQIAKLAKALAEAFLTVDHLVRAVSEARAQESDVTAGDINMPDMPIDPEAN